MQLTCLQGSRRQSRQFQQSGTLGLILRGLFEELVCLEPWYRRRDSRALPGEWLIEISQHVLLSPNNESSDHRVGCSNCTQTVVEH